MIFAPAAASARRRAPAVATLMLLASAAAAGEDAGDTAHYDLQSVRSFLDSVGGAIDFEPRDVHFPDSGGVLCYGVDVIELESLQRRSFDRGRATAAARAAGAPGDIEPAIGAVEGECRAALDFAGELYSVDLGTYEATALPGECPEAEPRVVRDMFPMWGWDRREVRSPDGRWLATLVGDDIGLRPVCSDEPRRLTDDGTPEHQYFLASDIWEASGDIWSPDSTRFVGRVHDTRHTNGIIVFDGLDVARVRDFRYWTRAAEPLPVTRLVVFDASKGLATEIDVAGDADSYLFFIDWTPDGRGVAFVRVARDLRSYELFEADAASGRARLLLRETRESTPVKWPGGPKTLHYLSSGEGFLWRSDRDGYFNYYLYSRAGEVLAQVTRGRYDAGTVVEIDEAAGRLYFMGGPEPGRYFDRQLLRAPLGGGPAERITRERGLHRVTLAPSGEYFVDLHSHLDRAPRLELKRSRDGASLMTLEQAEIPPWRASWPVPEEFALPIRGSEAEAHGLIFRPHDFDPQARYPVVERIYAGIQSTVSPRGYFGFGETGPGSEYVSLIAYLAARGFVVVTIDSRGTPGRGHDFNYAGYGSWPHGVTDDHAQTLRALAASRPWMDIDRTGVAGNSWGGYTALTEGLEAPDLYRAVSVSVPQTDFLDHVAWINFVLGAVDDNRETYLAGNLSARMAAWQPALQIVSGTADVNVPVTNTMKLLDSLAEHGKRYELVLFPGTNHTHLGRGDRYAYAVAAIADFFERHLGHCDSDSDNDSDCDCEPGRD